MSERFGFALVPTGLTARPARDVDSFEVENCVGWLGSANFDDMSALP